MTGDPASLAQQLTELRAVDPYAHATVTAMLHRLDDGSLAWADAEQAMATGQVSSLAALLLPAPSGDGHPAAL